jgi:hypothetical protein
LTLPLGPYTGSPIGSFVLWNITGHASRYGADRVISLEVVLPDGEIIRTGSSAFPGHEKLNPYFRYAYGPDLTGLFRGSFGAFGVVTKAVYQLYPLAEQEKHIDAGFDDLPSLLNAMKRIERYDISKFCIFYDRNFLVNTCAPSIKQLKELGEIGKLREIFPSWILSIGLSGSKELISLHEEMVLEEVSRNHGDLFESKSTPVISERMNDLIPGASRVINRMYEPHGSAASVVAVAPPYNIYELWKIAGRLVEEFDIRDPLTKNLLDPPTIGYPYDRGRNVYLERELSFDPLDTGAKEKITKARRAWVRKMIPLGGSLMMLNVPYTRMLMPTYSNFLKEFKKILDPYDILSPHKLVDARK